MLCSGWSKVLFLINFLILLFLIIRQISVVLTNYFVCNLWIQIYVFAKTFTETHQKYTKSTQKYFCDVFLVETFLQTLRLAMRKKRRFLLMLRSSCWKKRDCLIFFFRFPGVGKLNKNFVCCSNLSLLGDIKKKLIHQTLQRNRWIFRFILQKKRQYLQST